MKTKTLAPIHPGEILREEFMKPHELSQNALARALGDGLIERAVGERSTGWSEFMDQPRRRFKSQADEVRKASR